MNLAVLRWRREGEAQLRIVRELLTPGRPVGRNGRYAVRRALRSARYAYTGAARIIKVERERMASCV